MGWTDTGGNGKCQQQDLASLPQGFIGGGWVTYQGGRVCSVRAGAEPGRGRPAGTVGTS